MSGRPNGAQWRERRALMANLPPRLIAYLYHDMMMSMSEIAALINIPLCTLHGYMKRHDIQRRSPGVGSSIAKARKRQKKSLEELKAVLRRCGYEVVYLPEHPRADRQGYVFKHILVAEQMIGHPLKPDEVVHHINGIKNDNRPENLQVMTDHDHRSYHIKEAIKRRRAAMEEQHRQEAAQNGP